MMKVFSSLKITIACTLIVLLTGQISAESGKKETVTPETKKQSQRLLKGIPLSCYRQVGVKGIHPSVTSSLTELANFQSAQWAEISLKYAEYGDLESAIAITRKIEDYLTKNQTLVELAGQLATRGEYQQAKQLVETIEEYETYRAKGLARIGRYYSIAGNESDAKKMFDSAIAFTKTLNAEFIRPTAFAEIAIEYAGAGKEKEAMQSIADINDKNSRAMALAGIASELVSTRSLDRVLQIVQTIEDDYYRAQALTDIAKKVKTTQLDSVVQIVNTIEDETNKDSATAEIAVILIQAGQFDRAFELTQTLLENGDSLLAKIIAEYAKAGQMEQAKALLNSIDNQYWQEQSLIKIISGYAYRGEFDTALKYTDRIDSPKIKNSALMVIGKQYAESKKYSQAERLFASIEATTTNEATSFDIKSYYAPLVNCAISTTNFNLSLFDED